MKTGAEASRTERAAVSFLGAFLGWCMAYWGYTAYQVHAGGFGRVTDFAAMLFWPAAHIFVWWLVFVLPVVMLVDPRHWMFRISVFPFFLGLYALVGYMILLAWAGLSFHVHFQIYASVVGVVAGLTYSVEIQTRIAGRVLALLRLPKVAMFVVPPLSVVVFCLGIWPIIEAHCPAFACRYGGSTVSQRVTARILNQVQVGDRLEDLHQLLPDRFLSPDDYPPERRGRSFGSMGVHMSGVGSWSIKFRDGVVTEVEVNEPP